MSLCLRLLPAILLAIVLSGCGSETGKEDPGEEAAQGASGAVVVTTGKGEVFEFGNFEGPGIAPSGPDIRFDGGVNRRTQRSQWRGPLRH